MSWSAKLGSGLRRTHAAATRRPHAKIWTLVALACALFVAGLAVTIAASIDRWAGAHPGRGGAMVVYLGEEVDDARARALVGELRGLAGVVSAELVPPAESARRLTRALGADPALLAGVELESLPASVEVALAPGVRDVIAMSPTVRALRGAPGVAEVVVPDSSPDEAIAGALGPARAIAWTAAALFAGLALLIVLAQVRLGLARPRREAAVLELLGASPGFAAIPSALAGALYGLIAATAAAAALVWLVPGAASPWGELAPPALALAGLLGLGALVGLVGGALAGSQHD